MELHRPDPDHSLKKREEKGIDLRRAKLKIFFGMAPGVGKTHTMLKVARELRDEGVEIVIGAIESHGRPETLALTEGFEALPKKTLPYHGKFLEEFDLAQALERKPRLILIDDLAHTNVHGSLHHKRWQDVWDLLDAGIDVFTTLNVQHIESLRDVVAQITGVIVQENVPDTVLKRADEIEIVDLPPDELIQRLKEGKVFVPDHARHAVERFFRKGNLLALRELALRRVAEHVDADMRRYMSSKGIDKTWAVGERLLVCISPSKESSRLIRATRRMADSLNAPWVAAYVENARGLRHSAEDRARLEDHLRLVERLGGETVVTQGGVHIAQDILNLARARNVSKVLLGRPRKPRWLEFFTGSLLAELVRRSGDIDVLVITGEGEPEERSPIRIRTPRPRLAMLGHILWAGVAVAMATGIGLLIHKHLAISEIVMVYLLAILAVGLRFGRSASMAASIFSVIALDLVFVPPAFSFNVDDLRSIGTFAVMLVVGYIIGNLVERVHAQTRLARAREQRVLALFGLAAELTKTPNSTAMVESAIHRVADQFQSKVCVLLPDSGGRLQERNDMPRMGKDEMAAAQWAFDHRDASGLGTEILPASKALYLPLTGTKATLGVMGIQPDGVPRWVEPDQRHLLEAFGNQTALALERAILAERDAEHQRRMERAGVRNALLTSVSENLHRPLGVMDRAITSLLEDPDGSEETRKARLETVHEEIWGLRRLIANLVELTLLESGELTLTRAPVAARSLVESVLERMRPILGDRVVKVELSSGLPTMDIDAALLELVLINVLENARHCSPEGTPIEVKGWATDSAVTLAITDHGSGIPEGEEERIFEKLVSLPSGQGAPGAGLGLAIAKGLVEAHGGWIQAGNRPSGGAQVLLSLPLREPQGESYPIAPA